MTSLCCDVLKTLRGKTLVTAESLTGGGIGAALTQVPGSSEVYKGGVICYTNWVKENILGVPGEILAQDGAVSRPTAEHLASGVRALLKADVAVAVTGLAGPAGTNSDTAWERSSSAIRTRRIPTQGNITSLATGKRCGIRPLKPR